jgi:hypothetical protein
MNRTWKLLPKGCESTRFFIFLLVQVKVVKAHGLVSSRINLNTFHRKAMNRLAIQLNNRGVAELKQGNMFQALELLSNASSIVTQDKDVHVDAQGQTYLYHWEDCSSSLAPQASKSLQVSNEGSMSFLCLRFLRITAPEGFDQLDMICPW